jgi:hypothetical protein
MLAQAPCLGQAGEGRAPQQSLSSAGRVAARPIYAVTSLAAVSLVAFAALYRVLTHARPKRAVSRSLGMDG